MGNNSVSKNLKKLSKLLQNILFIGEEEEEEEKEKEE
jgi:hypothetical protein